MIQRIAMKTIRIFVTLPVTLVMVPYLVLPAAMWRLKLFLNRKFDTASAISIATRTIAVLTR